MKSDTLEPYVLIEASAGTGKTQALGERLIALLHAGVKPQEIVALTFSRAAAGEIFERFVSLLAERATGSTEDAQCLREVLATQHLSQIGTLDSFLMRIVRAFPLELGLIGDLELMDSYEAERARAAISFSILRRTDAKAKKAFVEAFSLAMDRQDVRSFVTAYHAFISTWHKQVLALPDARMWGLDVPPDDEPFVGTQHPALQDFFSFVRDFRGDFSAAKGLAKKFVESSEAIFRGATVEVTFRGKSQPFIGADAEAIRAGMRRLYNFMIRRKSNLARGVFTLVSAFEAAYAKRVRATGKLTFDDVPRLIAALSEEHRLALEFRLDSHIRAWALDEFQDTSRAQWGALANLIDEAKQSGGDQSVFIVGDVKQAIYGWREGDVGIFRREKESGCYRLIPRDATYRSGPAIVAAVNRVFARGRILTDFPAWHSPEHTTAKPELDGFVRVAEATGRRMDDFVAPVLNALRVNRAGSTAILVRGNDFGRFLVNELKRKGVRNIVWEGDSEVFDTPALAGFLDLVQLADHPGDALTYRHFRMTALATAKYPDGVPEAAVVSREMAEAFTTRGLVRTFRELRALLPEDPAQAWSVFTEERFTDLLRAAASFELGLSAGSRLADFSRYLAAQKKRTSAAPGQVRVMTIHAAKGLGFDHVILPLYESRSLTVESKDPLVTDEWILPDPGKETARGAPELQAATALRRDRAEQEALCVYYVAMTRARQGLSIVTQPASKNSNGVIYFSDLVRAADLSDLIHSEFAWPAAEGESAHESARTPLAAPVRAARRSVHRRLPSQLFVSGQSAGLLFTARASREAARRRGIVAHAEMERVEFSEALPKPEGFVALWREKPFEVFADGEWISGRFDRVTFFKKGGELHAEIIDFKSSLEHPERYDAQLATYARAVSALTGIPRAHIAARLVQTPRD